MESYLSEPRAWTEEEVREKFLDQVRGLADYWSKTDRDPKGMCNGLAFSILNIFDGTTMGLPAMDITCQPHPNDKAYLQDCGENWYEPGMVFNDCHLHDAYYKKDSE
jgi:hypothetical protein